MKTLALKKIEKKEEHFYSKELSIDIVNIFKV